MSGNEPVTVVREVAAQKVPSGDRGLLRPGQSGWLTQAMGGAFSVYIDGTLWRIDGADGDAIGKAPVLQRQFPSEPTDDEVREFVWDELRQVYDPEIPCSIVDLGLVYTCDIDKRIGDDFNVSIRMTVTAPGCGMGEQLANEVAARLDRIPRVADYQVQVVFDPPWDRSMMSEAAQLQLGVL